jgi:hypothetical protein
MLRTSRAVGRRHPPSSHPDAALSADLVEFGEVLFGERETGAGDVLA